MTSFISESLKDTSPTLKIKKTSNLGAGQAESGRCLKGEIEKIEREQYNPDEEMELMNDHTTAYKYPIR